MFVFYDFETTDLNTVGQIFDYAFVPTNDDFDPHPTIKPLVGKIRLSRLTLPAPMAIKITNLDIMEHQDTVKTTERQAMLSILNYLDQCIVDVAPEPVYLIGYNNLRFDLNYLRTSLIRNGLNPYLGKSLVHKDLMQNVYSLIATTPSIQKKIMDENNGKLSFTLDVVSRALLQSTPQTHGALSDVNQTILLAKLIRNVFQKDILEEQYQADKHETQVGNVVFRTVLDTNATTMGFGVSGTISHKPMIFLRAEKNHALWLDLDDAVKNPKDSLRDSIRWFNKNTNQFLVTSKQSTAGFHEHVRTLLKDALKFIPPKINDFFEERDCDVEQHIYKISFAGIDALHDAIWNHDITAIKDLPADQRKLAAVVLLRNQLANAKTLDDRMKEVLRKYAVYRYGGQMKIDGRGAIHPTLTQMQQEAIDIAGDFDATKQDKLLMARLLSYYAESDIYTVAYSTLMRDPNENTVNVQPFRISPDSL